MKDAPEGLRYPFAEPPEPGGWREVAEGILWARLPLPMVLDHVNVYLLDEGDSWTLIDTGLHSKKTIRMWEALLAGPCGGRPVSRVMVTHHHLDHVGCAGWFQERGAELCMTRTAWLMARMLQLDLQERYTPEAIAFYRGAGMDAGVLEKRSRERPFNSADGVHAMPLGFTRLVEGQGLRMGGRDWVVRLGDGHAPRHATFWSDDVVLAGDQILPTISPNIGVYPTEPDADPLEDWIAACRRLAPHAREEHLVLGGHKLPFTGLPKRMEMLEDNHHSALNRLRAHLSEPRTAGECFPPLFKRRIGEGEYGLALVESVAHCNHLWHKGEATRTRRDDGAWVFHVAGG
ncbi:MBL fold metallo-hydrolase [Pseudaestuariivita atlantica]|uniref:Metallo-beta-lactamase n=1 Tax=Pseudaestuariivita atlantica TaxID=1317121 RepID=A0A0L1JLF4_9RHOB|nr:MBL fold metallo-hydrolase [Pseudaestuariivita atlantica]KNG92581.1 metallo-beta-lactamase [Pseudaestuariivita atlantica]